MNCRICGAKISNIVLSLENMPLTDDLIKASCPEKEEYINDIKIYCCDVCEIVQNPENFHYEDYYKDYQYSSGHSVFTKKFMLAYASITCEIFKSINNRFPESVIEIGSGDGQQLFYFKEMGLKKIQGVEPSSYLADIAQQKGINTEVNMFGTEVKDNFDYSYDICISSYTFDHVRNPINYLITAHNLLKDNGLLALEIHDLDKIIDRTEYCLFEHEHTIYLNKKDIVFMLEAVGFAVEHINPIHDEITRGNSLIVIAKKKNRSSKITLQNRSSQDSKSVESITKRINSTIGLIDKWIAKIPRNSTLVGFGAGGRGVMSIALLAEYKKIKAILDSNYQTGKYLTPKTRIPIVGPNQWSDYSDSYCIIFSYGYYDEILRVLVKNGFDRGKIVSLLDFYPKNN